MTSCPQGRAGLAWYIVSCVSMPNGVCAWSCLPGDEGLCRAQRLALLIVSVKTVCIVRDGTFKKAWRWGMVLLLLEVGVIVLQGWALRNSPALPSAYSYDVPAQLYVLALASRLFIPLSTNLPPFSPRACLGVFSNWLVL